MHEELYDLTRELSEKSNQYLADYFNKENIELLHKLKLFLDDQYYNSHEEPKFSDYQYDLLKETIQRRDPLYVPPVGAKIRTGENRVMLPYWLGSMNKLKPEDTSELQRWLNKNGTDNGYIIEDKLDGISCLITVINGEIKLYTRGDGITGADISYLTPYFKSIPVKILKQIKDDIAIRGELIMKRDLFKSKYSHEFANPRNFVSGRIGSKTARHGLEDIDFIAYELVGNEKMSSPESQLSLLGKIGFTVVPYSIIKDLTTEILIELFILRKQESEYEVDGIIVQPNSTYFRNNSGNPSYAFAFKMRTDENLILAEVEEVEWNVSKWGTLKPRIRIKPVHLSGVTITYTSGFNAKYINDNNIGKGSLIKITRSGDVIPHIIEVVKSTIAEMPKMNYKWNESGVDIYTDESEDISCIKLISSFFSTLKIKYVSEMTVSKLYKHGFNTIIKIIGAKAADFEPIEGFGKTLAKRTYENIHNGLQDVSIPTLLGASGVFGFGMGTRKLETLFNAMPNILVIYKEIDKDELYDIVNSVEGFSDITTTKIIENLYWAEKFIESIQPYITVKTIEIASDDLKDNKIVFSGFRDKKLEEEIIKRGGKVTTSVSKNTTIVVVADKSKTSEKIQKAMANSTPIYDKDEFKGIYNF